VCLGKEGLGGGAFTATKALQQRISLYADDVVIFLHPATEDIGVTLDILQLFEEASGLQPNVQKTSVLPIQYREEDREFLLDNFLCPLSDFPCKYMVVPLLPLKLTKNQMQPLVDKIADRLPSWKANLLTKSGRKFWYSRYSLLWQFTYLWPWISFHRP
jgi:hypothetical protein